MQAILSIFVLLVFASGIYAFRMLPHWRTRNTEPAVGQLWIGGKVLHQHFLITRIDDTMIYGEGYSGNNRHGAMVKRRDEWSHYVRFYKMHLRLTKKL